MKIKNAEVAEVFFNYASPLRDKLLFLRKLIFEVAKENPIIGKLEETLRWGQPSYLTTESGSGTMIRLDQFKKTNESYAMFVHCQTNLIDKFRKKHGKKFLTEGTRAIVFGMSEKIDEKKIKEFIREALMYKIK